MKGQISSSLLDLPRLMYLDLSLNDFRQEQVPEFIGSLENLEYLNLSNANLWGKIPDQLGNLSSLVSLDLSGNGFSLRANNLDWVFGLSRLEVLDLGGVDLSIVSNWFDMFSRLSSLRVLSLFACRIRFLPLQSAFANSSSLEILDLSFNHFNSPIPYWILNMSQNLVHFNLRGSRLHGEMPNSFGTLTSLFILDLSDNSLTGHFPTSLGGSGDENDLNGTPPLKELHLANNHLEGRFVETIARFSQLEVLDVASNLMKDVVSEQELMNFSHLRVLDLSSNSMIVFNICPSWLPLFQLDVIHLESCHLGPPFPNWLRRQKAFSSIDISNAGISGEVPDWFWNQSVDTNHMNLSNNQLRGKVPDLSRRINLAVLDMSSNSFLGQLPRFPVNLVSLILSMNEFSGSITPICHSLVPNNYLSYLDLSYNILSGPFFDCWAYGQDLVVLILAKNNLSGKIPSSIKNLVHLKALRLDMNAISGNLPSSLQYLTNLFVLDLAYNMLTGRIPLWIGESLPNLMILRLGENNFSGGIPSQICQLKQLVILNLASNHLSGSIPRCIDKFLTMAMIEAVQFYTYDPYTAYSKDLQETLIKIDNRIFKFISWSMIIDLSSNELTGEIPGEVTSLIGLVALNLSHNNFTRAIPTDIGLLSDLQVLDLSRNRLSCHIPNGIIDLSYLSLLDLSYNNLSGKIPLKGQLLTFEASSFMKNGNLCGVPLERKCSGPVYDDPQCGEKINLHQEKEGHIEITSFYVSMGIGLVTVVWVQWVVLLLNGSWRAAYARFLDKLILMVLQF